MSRVTRLPWTRSTFIERRSFRLAGSLILGATLWTGCGPYSPIVDSSKDIKKLDPSEEIIRARGLSDDDISALTHLKELRHLQFGAGHKAIPSKLTDAGLKRLSSIDLPKLRILDLGRCDLISDAGLSYVAGMTNLDHLILIACPRISDAGIHYVAKMENLNSLGLASCSGITDSGVKELRRLHALERLDLRGCLGITDASLKFLAEMKQLQHLDVGGCDTLSQNAIEEFRKALPGARVRKDERAWKSERE